jgi:hypothetical protein
MARTKSKSKKKDVLPAEVAPASQVAQPTQVARSTQDLHGSSTTQLGSAAAGPRAAQPAQVARSTQDLHGSPTTQLESATGHPRAAFLQQTPETAIVASRGVKRARDEEDDDRIAPTKQARLEAHAASASKGDDSPVNPRNSKIPQNILKSETQGASFAPDSPIPQVQIAGSSLQASGVPITQSSQDMAVKSLRQPSAKLEGFQQPVTPSLAPSDRLASLRDLSDPVTLQSLLDGHDEEAFRIVRKLTGNILDHLNSKKDRYYGHSHWQRYPIGNRSEAGTVIYVPIVVQRGDKLPPSERDLWWIQGPDDMIYMMNFVPALVLFNGRRIKKLKIFTTLSSSDLDQLRTSGRLNDYVHVTRTPEEDDYPDEPCHGRLRFRMFDHARSFPWKNPRFIEADGTYDYPHGLPYQRLGEVCHSGELKYLLEIMTATHSNIELDLSMKYEEALEREELESRARTRGRRTLQAPRKSPDYHLGERDTSVNQVSCFCAF